MGPIEQHTGRTRVAWPAQATLVLLVAAAALAAGTPRPAHAQAEVVVPDDVRQGVLTAYTLQVGTLTGELMVLRAEPVTWSDGCMGIGETSLICTQAQVPGWVVWVSEGGTAYRFHTDLDGAESRLAQSGIQVSTVEVVGIPGAATRRSPGAYVGTAPDRGRLGLLVTAGVAEAQGLVTALGARGCVVNTLAVIDGGRWRVFVAGAPATVNAGFPPLLAERVAFAVRCR